MKSDLDALMKAKGVDGLVVLGNGQHNPPMVYMTGGGHILDAILAKKTGEEPILFHGPMERDEAAKTGLRTICYDQYSFAKFLKEADGDNFLANALWFTQMLADAGITEGKVALYGRTDIGKTYAKLANVEKNSGLSFSGDLDGQVLQKAAQTKDASEIQRIKKMADITVQVVGNTQDFLSNRPVRQGKLLNSKGDYLTIGEVKSRINLWLAEAGVENPEGTIFSIGRDAGVPHSSGTNTDVIETGKTIVFDIFPCEAQGGYYYDFTRTWCLGYAPDEVLEVFQQVKEVYTTITESLVVDRIFSQYQVQTCEIFEKYGHPTPRTHPTSQTGYVHSVGHGVGLNIHERPFSRISAGSDETLARGSVFTIEPGLYYPDKGFGVRIEDSYWVTEQGEIKKFADYPYDLVIPLNRNGG